MRMLQSDTRRYPKTAYYVRHDLPSLLEVPAIVRAINRIGQIDRATLQAALRWGVGPLIRIVPLVGNSGEFTPNRGSIEIRVNTALVVEFENGKGLRKARSGNVYLLGVTLLHELIHWGDDQDGVDRQGEEGEEFERLVYGGVID